MKCRYFFGLILVVPISVLADGVGHVEVMWYQDPVTALSAVVAVVAAAKYKEQKFSVIGNISEIKNWENYEYTNGTQPMIKIVGV